MKPATEKRAEIYTYSSEDMVYAMNWSVRLSDLTNSYLKERHRSRALLGY